MSSKIVGPFWEADVQVVQVRFADPKIRQAPVQALRALFVDNTKNATTDSNVDHLATTLLMLADVRKVQVREVKKNSGTYFWSRKPGGPSPKPVSDADLEDLLRGGELVLLLVEADGDEQTQSTDQYTCLAGEINLDPLRPIGNARERLFLDLNLESANPGQRSGAANLTGSVTVHSSGLSLYGQVTLPWQEEAVKAPFQLTERLPGGDVLLTIEEERLTESERSNWIEAWNKLSVYVNPARPLDGVADAPPLAPHWVTLEIANPEDVPQLYWEWDPTDASEAEGTRLYFQTGQINLLLSDQQPYCQEYPPTSLARIVPGKILVTRDGDELSVEVSAGSKPDAKPGSLSYVYGTDETGDGSPDESLTLSGVQVAYDPIQTPEFLRQHQDLPTPEWTRDKPVEPAMLWGFMPLADGWVQLPVPNLSEQIYLDAELEGFPHAPGDTPPALLQGAVTFGNDTPNIIARHPNEQPWNLTLTGAQQVTGTWTLNSDGAHGFRLDAVTLDIVGPRLVVNGLFWLSTGRPTAADALPDLEDWTAGLESIPLRTADPARDLFPPLVTMTLGDQDQAGPIRLLLRQENDEEITFVSALLNAWSLSYQVDQNLQVDQTLFEKMQDKHVLPQNAFSRRPPWLWRRHPTLPMVQALPLTQSQSPPNYASPSRQLVPYQLTLDQDGVLAVFEGRGATAWAKLLSRAEPAGDWQDRADLPLVALSLPGLVLDPSLEGAGLGKDEITQLPCQYRFDLPYTDEINALAQLPEVVPDPEKVSPLPDSPRPEPAPPLTRETFGEHWARLSQQASLAAADAVEAFDKDGQTAVRHLVEPFDWPVQPTLDLDSYPGTLSLAEDADSLALSGESALRGISGQFAAATDGQIGLADGEENPFLIEAGGMAAHRGEDGMYRDQRGLWRGASVLTGSSGLIRTPVRLQQKEAGGSVAYDLTSALAPFELILGDPDDGRWQIWFRDLPARREDGTFDRGQVRSDQAQDVNDPGGLSREHDYLSGYEWRLGAGATPPIPLSLFDLYFYPLTLEKMVFAEEGIQHIEVVGRLQLPLADPREIEDLGNAVRLTFVGDNAEISLQAIALESDVGEWPLALQRGEDSGAPRLLWEGIELVEGKAQISGVRLRFFLFGVEWTHSLGTLKFPQEDSPRRNGLTVASSPGLHPQEPDLTLDPAVGVHQHQLSVTLNVGLGKHDDDAAPRFQASVKYDLLGAGAGTATLTTAALFEDLKLSGGEENIAVGERAMQFDFELSQKGDLQLLPGMGLQAGKNAPGFAALTFTARAKTDDLPDLQLTSAFMEALLFCRWPEAEAESAAMVLQDRGGGDVTEKQVFGSSAGDLVFGYTTQLKTSAWEESLLVNGFLELKNLISWPTTLTRPPEDSDEANKLILPLLPEDDKLAHTRHTIRVLFNQHPLPSESLVLSPGEELFFHLDKPWQFLAVVEHQLVEVAPTDGWETLKASNDRRWTTLQEVRLVDPQGFLDFLTENRDGYLDYGYLAGGLPDLLGPALEKLPETTLIVEASAPHWIRCEPLSGARMTTLQFLPNGSQHGILSSPADYAPSDPQDPDYLLLPMPFLGRLQEAESDFPPQSGVSIPLQVDPILLLRDGAAAAPQLAWILSHWRKDDTAPDTVIVSGFDTALGRTWARLDPTSLEENWFRLHNPIPEPQPTTTQSVMAALPDNPARLSRGTALRRAFDAFRPSYPPKLPDGSDWPAVEVEDEIVWRRDSVMVLQGVRLDTSSKNRIRNGFFKSQQVSGRPPDGGWQIQVDGGQAPAGWQVDSQGKPNARIRISQRVALEPGRFRFSISIMPPSKPKPSQVILFANHGRKRIVEHILETADFPLEKWTRVQVVFDVPASRGTVTVGVALRNPHSLKNSGWYLDRATLVRAAPEGWHITATQLRGIHGDGEETQRHAAATLIPAQLTIDGQENPRPLSLVVSPYLGLDFRRAADGSVSFLQLASVELLCLDAASGLLRPAASQFWEVENGMLPDAEAWARETHHRLCPESPIAILRFREINRVGDGADESLPPLTTTYRFAILRDLDVPATLARRVFRLRTAVDQLRFRDGQFGGNEIPEGIRPFEIAPPQTTGVQPLYLTERPAAASPGSWPWGLSALRLSLQYTPGKQGVIGPSGKPSNDAEEQQPLTLWWQAAQYFVQYRSPLTSQRPVWALPAQYRARAIKSLMPVLPALPLPTLDFTDQGQSGWQPVLPGALRYLISGARAGVLLAIRNQLLRQSDLKQRKKDQVGKGMISGSVPVQHRMPRPVPLPPNENREKALQPWASFFEPETNLLASSSPADEAFFASYTDGDGTLVPAKRLRMTLREPARGALTLAWNGDLVFEIQAESEDETDTINDLACFEVNVTNGDQTFSCKLENSEQPGQYRCVFDNAEAARKLLEGKLAGQSLTANAYVGHETHTDGFRQRLSFPLRVVDETRPPLPLAPCFLHFEDPEYNRRLSSPAAVAAGTFKDEEGNLQTVKLATDRREYNADSRLALRYDFDDGITAGRKADLTFTHIDRNGIEIPLEVSDSSAGVLAALPPSTLRQISLGDLRQATVLPDGLQVEEPVPWQQGNVLQLKLAYPSNELPDLEIYLEVRIVETPVIPAPEAAYALLRWQHDNSQVECVRFAWRPNASRVELVCAEDLRTEVVRRRAVFQWRDSVRPTTLNGYAIQKIAINGSTHFPSPVED